MTSSTKIALWVIGILVVIIGVSAYFMRNSDTIDNTQNKDNTIAACTLDTKMCPDGSYVGRVAPNCQFAACSTGTSTTPVGNGGDAYPADIMK